MSTTSAPDSIDLERAIVILAGRGMEVGADSAAGQSIARVIALLGDLRAQLIGKA